VSTTKVERLFWGSGSPCVDDTKTPGLERLVFGILH